MNLFSIRRTAARARLFACASALAFANAQIAMGQALPSPNLSNLEINGTSFLDANGLVIPSFLPKFIGGDLTGSFVSPVIANGAVTAAKLATGAAVANGALSPTGSGAGLTGITASQVGAAAKGANSDITSLVSLTTPLTAAQGGTGATSLAGGLAAIAASLPTSDPGVKGQPWNNGGLIAFSQ